MTRHELRQQLEDIYYNSNNIIDDMVKFIEQDRKRICQPLVEAIDYELNASKDLDRWLVTAVITDYIDDALGRAGIGE